MASPIITLGAALLSPLPTPRTSVQAFRPKRYGSNHLAQTHSPLVATSPHVSSPSPGPGDIMRIYRSDAPSVETPTSTRSTLRHRSSAARIAMASLPTIHETMSQAEQERIASAWDRFVNEDDDGDWAVEESEADIFDQLPSSPLDHRRPRSQVPHAEVPASPIFPSYAVLDSPYYLSAEQEHWVDAELIALQSPIDLGSPLPDPENEVHHDSPTTAGFQAAFDEAANQYHGEQGILNVQQAHAEFWREIQRFGQDDPQVEQNPIGSPWRNTFEPHPPRLELLLQPVDVEAAQSPLKRVGLGIRPRSSSGPMQPHKVRKMEAK